MTIAASVQSYLNRDGVRYEMITHERTRTAIKAHTPRTFRVANWRNASCCRTARDTRWPCFLPRTTESVPIDGRYGFRQPNNSRRTGRAACRPAHSRPLLGGRQVDLEREKGPFARRQGQHVAVGIHNPALAAVAACLIDAIG